MRGETNITSVVIGGVEEDTYNGCGKGWTFRRYGKVVSLSAPGDITNKAAGTVTMFNIDSKYRPSEIVRCPCANNQNGAYISIKPDGDVLLYSLNAISSATNGAFSCAYIVK